MVVNMLLIILWAFPAIRVEEPPVVDGFLTESCWRTAQVVEENFTAFRPRCDMSLSQPTTITILYDEEAIYFGCFMHDPDPSRMVHQAGARDEDAPVDKVYIYLDTFNDDANCFTFAVTADGTQIDSRRTEIGGDDTNWDAVWSSRVSESDSGWTAEISIPFSALRYSSSENQVWGVNVGRTISYSNEAGYLYRMREQGGIDVSLFGDLTGLASLPSNHGIEFRPFTAGRLQFSRSSSLFDDTWGSAGADVKIALDMQTVLDLSVFPDFGQVESDGDQGNISHWDPWLNEKRPFFMEGTEIFEMPFNMFYSRSIGSVASNGDLTDILGGAKVTGTSGGTRFGFLEVVTDEVRDDSLLVEPVASWMAGSVLHEFSRGNWLKVSGTSMDSFTEDESGVHARSASLMGLKTLGEYFRVQGQLGGTWNGKSSDSDNSALRIDAGYFPERFELNFRYLRRGEDFDQGTMGYFTGSGSEMWSAYSSVSREVDSDFIDQIWFDANPYYSTDLHGRNAGSGITVSAGGVTVNRYDLNVWVDYMDRWYDRYEGPDGRWYPEGFSGGISSSTDYRKPLAGWISVERMAYLGAYSNGLSLGLRIKPVPEIFITVEPSLDVREPAVRYNWETEEWEETDSRWQSMDVSATYFLTSSMRIRLNGQASRFERTWETETSSSVVENFWGNLLYSWEYSPGSWFHFLAGEVREGDLDPVFTVYAKVTRYF